MTTEREGDDLDREVADLEKAASKVQDDIDETRTDWEHKKDDPSVPGAAPEADVSDGADSEADSADSD